MMEIARAVILALPASDDRPWSSAGSCPKSLVPVANKPILFHTLEALRAGGITDVLVLTLADALRDIRRAVGDGSRWGMQVSCRAGDGPLTLAEVLTEADEFVGDGPVIVHQADALLRSGLGDHLTAYDEDDLDALVLMLATGRAPRPPAPKAVGHLLSAHAVRIIRDGPVEGDPLAMLRRHDRRVEVLNVPGCLVCHGDEATLLEANRHALTRLRSEVTDAMLEECEIQGSVVIHPTASLRNTLVRGPAIIGADTHLVDSYVGPYTSIGDGTRIQGTEIEHSIVMDGAKLMFVGSRLETSIIGRGASIVRRFDMPSAVRMMIGDGAEVALC